MRITNKIIQRNNLSNINTNKIYQDKLSTQMSTQKKVSRPSDDPVVAIRALRLRTSVTEITQYYSKNIPDAESWLSVTEDALKNLTEIVTSMIAQCTKGANGDLKSEDRQIILEQLKALGEEVYTTGDADYAGRYVFTGYRTDTSLSFMEAKKQPYEIVEQLDNKAITDMTKVDTGNLLDWSEANYSTLGESDEQAVKSMNVHRIRLAYNDCDANTKPTIEYLDAAGNKQTITADIMHSYENPSPYEEITTAGNEGRVIFVPETGELLLGENIYNELKEVKDDNSTVAENEGEIRITYRKENWAKGDLRPEHYFYCKSDPDDTDKMIEYNSTFLNGNVEKQAIEYDVGFNQTIRVNSTADECFQHGIGREKDDLVTALEEVLNLEAVKAKIEKKIEASGSNDTLKNQLDAVNKALTFSKDKCQKLFEQGITSFQKYLDDANLCITNCGTRSKKLELIENRMQNQKTTFETLRSENEDVDITDVAINLTSAELTYEAALMATGKVTQTTLLNYI